MAQRITGATHARAAQLAGVVATVVIVLSALLGLLT